MMTALAVQHINLTLFRPYSVFWDRGVYSAPSLNSEGIKAMSTKLKEQIVRQKAFPLRSTTSAEDVIWRHNNVLFANGSHLGSANLNFLFFPKPSKPPNWSKVLEINKLTRARSKNVKCSKNFDFALKSWNSKFWKNRLQKVVAMVTSNLLRQGLAIPNCTQVNFRKSHRVWWL